MVFLTMEPSQEPYFQAEQNKINAKVQSFVWVNVWLDWEQKELDANTENLMGTKGFFWVIDENKKNLRRIV